MHRPVPIPKLRVTVPGDGGGGGALIAFLYERVSTADHVKDVSSGRSRNVWDSNLVCGDLTCVKRGRRKVEVRRSGTAELLWSTKGEARGFLPGGVGGLWLLVSSRKFQLRRPSDGALLRNMTCSAAHGPECVRFAYDLVVYHDFDPNWWPNVCVSRVPQGTVVATWVAPYNIQLAIAPSGDMVVYCAVSASSTLYARYRRDGFRTEVKLMDDFPAVHLDPAIALTAAHEVVWVDGTEMCVWEEGQPGIRRYPWPHAANMCMVPNPSGELCAYRD